MRIDQLVGELTLGAAIRLKVNADEIRPVAKAIVDYLLEEYPSQDLYIPSPAMHPVEEIRQHIRDGRSMRWICARFKIDRRTVYRLLDAANDG